MDPERQTAGQYNAEDESEEDSHSAHDYLTLRNRLGAKL